MGGEQVFDCDLPTNPWDHAVWAALFLLLVAFITAPAHFHGEPPRGETQVRRATSRSGGTKETAMTDHKDVTLALIAEKHLNVPTLAERGSDRLDFSDQAVWALKAALEAAYEAGRVSREPELRSTRRELVGACQALRDAQGGGKDRRPAAR